MTRRALPALRVIRLYGEIVRQLGSEKSGQIDPKNEDISFSMSSFGLGLIFVPRPGQDLSRNAFVVSILSPGEKLYIGEGFFDDPEESNIS